MDTSWREAVDAAAAAARAIRRLRRSAFSDDRGAAAGISASRHAGTNEFYLSLGLADLI